MLPSLTHVEGVKQRSTLAEATNARIVESRGTVTDRTKRKRHRSLQMEALIRTRAFLERAAATSDITCDSALHFFGADEVGARSGLRINARGPPT